MTKIFHISFLLILIALVIPIFTDTNHNLYAAQSNAEDDEDDHRIKIPGRLLKKIYSDKGVADLRHITDIVEKDGQGNKNEVADKGLDKLRDILTRETGKLDLKGADTVKLSKLARDSKTIDAAKRIFADHPWEEVEKLAKKSKKPPLDAHNSDLLGRARRQMINDAMAKTIKSFDPDRTLGISIGMLDSGNKNSGIASDVDQTIFLMPSDKVEEALKKLGLKSESQLINKVIEKFNAEFKGLYDVTPARLGIESMNGADFFPDWRSKNTMGAFEVEVDRVVGEKRANPEAYRSEGQLKSQAEGRGYETLKEHSLRSLHMDRLIAELDKVNNQPDGESKRAKNIQDFIEHYSKQKEFAHVEFDPKNPEASLEKLKAEFERHSPWTEVEFDPKNPDGEPKVSHLADTREKVLKMEPEMVKRFAFDGSWDNWLMFDHHPGNRTKYLLRSFAEGASLLRKLKGDEKLRPQEYEPLYKKFMETGDPKPLNDLIKNIYSDNKPLSDAELKKIRNTMDVAAKARLLHKDKTLPGIDPSKMTPSQMEALLYKEFMPPLTDVEKLSGYSPEILQKARLEAAKKSWEQRARKLMIDNMSRAVKESAYSWDAGITEKEIKKLQKLNHPVAPRDKQQAAIEKSLFHGISDLMGFSESGKRPSFAFARAMIEKDPKKKAQLLERAAREGDLSLKLMNQLKASGSDILVRQLERIARDAAITRLSVEPDSVLKSDRLRDFAYYDHLLETLKKLPISEDTYRRAVANFESGHYKPQVVARRMLLAGSERAASALVEIGGNVGLGVKGINVYWPIMAENKLPTIEIEWGKQKFSGKKLVTNMMSSAGNYDSALQVIYAYQNQGPEEAAWVAAREMFMNLPYVAQGAAIYDMLVNHNPQGVVMLGGAIYVPVLGQAYIAISMTTTGISILGNYYLQPLKNDLTSKTYMGYIAQTEQGWIDWIMQRPGWKEDELSQRENILYRVETNVLYHEVKNQKGDAVPMYEVPEFSKEKAFDMDFISSTLNDDYEYLVKKRLLGGGEKWQELKDKAATDHRSRFESQRTGMFYHYEKRLIAFLRTEVPDEEGNLYTVHDGSHLMAAPWLEIDEPEKVFEHIAAFCIKVVLDWITATGDYSQLDENVILEHKFDYGMRQQLALRMAEDMLRSYDILRGAQYSKENQIKSQAWKALKERRAAEVHGRTFALYDARTAEDPDEAKTLLSVALIHNMHKNMARKPAPRVHVRPRVVMQKKPGEEESSEVVELLISVVANDDDEYALPGEIKHPGPYRYKQKSFVEKGKLIVELTVLDANNIIVVHWKDRNGKEMPYSWRGEIGSTEEILEPEPPALDLKVSDDGYVKGVAITPKTNPKAKYYELRRSPTAEGPFTVLRSDIHPVDKEKDQSAMVDNFPAAIGGKNEWYYIALPKKSNEYGIQVEEPDISQASSITVDLTIPPPKLKEGFDYLPGKREEPPPDRSDESAYARWEEDQYVAIYNYGISWKQPELRPPLDKVPLDKVKLQMLLAGPDGQFKYVDNFAPDEDYLKSHKKYVPGYTHYLTSNKLNELLPGMTGEIRARWIVPTRGGSVASDWANIKVTMNTTKNIIDDWNKTGFLDIPLVQGQSVRFVVDRAEFLPMIGFKEYFVPHGTEGIDESSYKRYIDDERKEKISGFWDAYDEPADRVGERYEKLKEKLKTRLDDYEKIWFDYQKENSLLPSAKLGALIGGFKRYAIDMPSDEKKNLKEEYFLIGNEAVFTAPETGHVQLHFNKLKRSNKEYLASLFVSYEYLNESSPGNAPSFDEPQWEQTTSSSDEVNLWKLTLPVTGNKPEKGFELKVYGSSFPEGPWKDLYHNVPYSEENTSFVSNKINPGDRAYFRTRLSYIRPGKLGSTWSEPFEVYFEPKPVKLPAFKKASYYGQQGDVLTVSAKGDWDPVRVEGVSAYGADGIPDSVILDKVKGENSSNKVSDATVGLVRHKRMLKHKSKKAGSLMAYFVPTVPKDQQTDLSPLYVEMPNTWTRTVMGAGSEWSYEFPIDGVLTFFSNHLSSPTSLLKKGGGELELNVTIQKSERGKQKVGVFQSQDLMQQSGQRSNNPSAKDFVDSESTRSNVSKPLMSDEQSLTDRGITESDLSERQGSSVSDSVSAENEVSSAGSERSQVTSDVFPATTNTDAKSDSEKETIGLVNNKSIEADLSHTAIDEQTGKTIPTIDDHVTEQSQQPVEGDYDAGFEAYVNGDFKTALEQLTPVAQKGDPKAQFALGLLYHAGKGVKKSYVKAYMWYSLAEANGHKRAAKNKSDLARKMSLDQIEEAEKLSKEYLESLLTSQKKKNTEQMEERKDNTLKADNFQDDFSGGDFKGWETVDEVAGSSSRWEVKSERLVQLSNIHGPSSSAISKRKGTYVYWGDHTAQMWTDYTFSVTVNSNDNDGIGVLFRYQSPLDFYKLEIDYERNFRSLVRVAGGVETSLATVKGKYPRSVDMVIKVIIIGDSIEVFLDGANVFDGAVAGNGLNTGSVGLYSWGNEGVIFDDVEVMQTGPAASARKAPVSQSRGMMQITSQDLTTAQPNQALSRNDADQAMLSSRYQDAFNLYQKQLQGNPRDVTAAVQLAKILEYNGNFDQAVATATSAMGIATDETERTQVRNQLVNAFLGKQDWENAQTWINLELKNNPGNALAESYQASIIEGKGMDVKMIQAAYDKVRNEDQNVGLERFDQGIDYYQIGHFSRAIIDFLAASHLLPFDPKPYYWLARCYGKVGWINQATMNYQHYIKYEPDQVWKARASFELQRLEMSGQIGPVLNQPSGGSGIFGTAGLTVKRAYAKKHGASLEEGVLITSVVPGKPADRAGIQLGDIVTTLNGERILTAEQFAEIMSQKKPGETMYLSIVRNKLSYGVQIILADKLPGPKPIASARGKRRHEWVEGGLWQV